MISKGHWKNISKDEISMESIKNYYNNDNYRIIQTKLQGGASFTMTVGGGMVLYVLSGLIRVNDSEEMEDISSGEYINLDRGRYRIQSSNDGISNLVEVSFVEGMGEFR